MLANYYAEITLFSSYLSRGGERINLRSQQLKHTPKVSRKGSGGQPPRPASPLSFAPSLPGRSLVAIWVMKHPATGSHALGTWPPPLAPKPQARPAWPRRVPGPPPPASSHRHSNISSSPALPRAGQPQGAAAHAGRTASGPSSLSL